MKNVNKCWNNTKIVNSLKFDCFFVVLFYQHVLNNQLLCHCVWFININLLQIMLPLNFYDSDRYSLIEFLNSVYFVTSVFKCCQRRESASQPGWSDWEQMHLGIHSTPADIVIHSWSTTVFDHVNGHTIHIIKN